MGSLTKVLPNPFINLCLKDEVIAVDYDFMNVNNKCVNFGFVLSCQAIYLSNILAKFMLEIFKYD